MNPTITFTAVQQNLKGTIESIRESLEWCGLSEAWQLPPIPQTEWLEKVKEAIGVTEQKALSTALRNAGQSNNYYYHSRPKVEEEPFLLPSFNPWRARLAFLQFRAGECAILNTDLSVRRRGGQTHSDLCAMCTADVPETPCHVLLECQAYEEIRKPLTQRINTILSKTTNLDTTPASDVMHLMLGAPSRLDPELQQELVEVTQLLIVEILAIRRKFANPWDRSYHK